MGSELQTLFLCILEIYTLPYIRVYKSETYETQVFDTVLSTSRNR